MENFSFLNPQNERSSKSSYKLMAKDVFETNKETGYLDKQTFMSLINQLRAHSPGLYREYDNFFRCMAEGFNISRPIVRKTHRTNGSDYIHLTFSKGRVTVSTTVYLICNLEKLINDYAAALVTPDFLLEDLIKYAENE